MTNSEPLDAFEPASNDLIRSLTQAVADVHAHDHPKHSDLYCLNLTSYAGDRMGPVLRRLADIEQQRDWYARTAADLLQQRTEALAGEERARDAADRLSVLVAELTGADIEGDRWDGAVEMLGAFVQAHRLGPVPDDEPRQAAAGLAGGTA